MTLTEWTVLMFRGPAHGYSANLYVVTRVGSREVGASGIVVRSRLRFAAGACVLAAGVLMGGGTVAVADPGLGGSAPNGDGNGTNNPVGGGPTAGSPVGNVTNTVRKTTQGVTGTPGSGAQRSQQPSTGATSKLGSGRQPGQQASTSATSPKTEAGGTDEDQKEDGGLVTADPNPVAAVPHVVAPVINAAVAPVPDAVAPVTTMLAPVSDVIAPGHDLLTSVAGAVVPLTQLPSDLSSFMLGITGVAPAGGSAGIGGAALSAAAGASVAPQLPLGPPVAGISGVPVTGNATRVATLDVILLGRASGMAPRASNAASLMGAESSFRHAFDELLLVASLSVLAAVALPGVGGLVTLTVVGVRIQYGSLKPDSRREHRALRASPVLRAVKRWMSG